VRLITSASMSLDGYIAKGDNQGDRVGYELVGTVPETEFGSLPMLALPDDEFVTLELVQWPDGHPDGMTRSDLADPGQSR
jgi:hypothetical protein